MTYIAQDYDALRVNQLVEANMPGCRKHLYDDFNRKCGTNRPTGFTIGPNVTYFRENPNHFKSCCGQSAPANDNVNKFVAFVFIAFILFFAAKYAKLF